MFFYLTLFGIPFVLTLILTPQIRRLARALGAVDIPNDDRRIHTRPTPRLGGVAIYLAFIITLSVFLLFSDTFDQNLRVQLQWYKALLVPTTLIFLLGIYDDLRGASAKIKITVQSIAALILYAMGFGITHLSMPLGGSWELPVWLSVAVTIVWIVGITNAFNLIDGIDGLATGASAFALISILFFSLSTGLNPTLIMSLILVSSLLAFLRYNFHPATIFLGDSGSLWLGSMVATLSLAGVQKGTTLIAISIPLVSFGFPILEVGLSLLRRFVSGKPLLLGDRGHIHHRLLEHGLSQKQTAILLYGVCALFTLFGILLLDPARSFSGFIFFLIGVLTVLGVWRLRYPEFEKFRIRLKKKKNIQAGYGKYSQRNLKGRNARAHKRAPVPEIISVGESEIINHSFPPPNSRSANNRSTFSG